MSHQETHAFGGRKSQPPRYRFEAADYEQFHVIAVTSGKLMFFSAGRTTGIHPGGIALLRAGSAFHLWTEEEGYEGVCFVATGSDRPEYRGPAVALQADGVARAIISLMEREARNPAAGSAEVLQSLGRALGWQAIRLGLETGRRSGREREARHWAERAREAIEATLYTDLSARQALTGLGLSYRQIARHFAQCTGTSPKEYQIQVRIREAKRLLRETRMSVTAIALELGYSSSQHFASQFREMAGRSPSEFRTTAADLRTGAKDAEFART